MEPSLTSFDPSAYAIDWEMPVEVMRDFDTILLFGKLTAATPADLTIRRISKEACFPIIDREGVVLVRCYDMQADPVLLRARVIQSTGLDCTVGNLELLPYKTSRQYARYPLCPPGRVFVWEDGAGAGAFQPCQLLNISSHGACIVAECRYPVGQALRLAVDPAETEESASYPCTIVRMTPRWGGQFEYGLSFAQLNKQRRGRLFSALQDRFPIYFGARGGFLDE